MTYTKKLMQQGSWSLRMKDRAPEQLTDLIEYAGHIVITENRIDPEALSDSDILTDALYVGVVTRKPTGKQLAYGGFGLIWWLGSNDRGKIYRGSSAIDWTNQGFEDAIDDILATPTPITKGSVESTAGTYTQSFDLKNQRVIMLALTSAFGAEFRVNNDFTLDAGASGYLYNSTPTAIIARKFEGLDPEADGLAVSELSVEADIEEFTTTAIIAAEGTGETLVTAEVSLSDKLFLDPQGNDIDRSYVVNEPSTTSATASDRAQTYLDVYGVIRKAVKVDLKDFDIKGKFEVGDLIAVWDPRSELTDNDNEWGFRGELLNPIYIRVVSETDPIRAHNGVYYRSTATPPVYTDLSDWFEPDSGSSKIEVSASSRNLVTGTSEALDARISIDPDGNDTLGPDVPAHASTPWSTTTYLDSQGIRKSRIVAVWSTPTNTDTTTVTDGSHYTVRYRQNGESEYQYLSVDWSINTCSINELAPGVLYEISVSASDVNGNNSGYDTDESVTAAQASGVPSQPAVPTVAGNPLNIQVVHDLQKNAGGDLETDLDHLVVYGDTTSPITPSSANRLGEIPATAAHIALGIPVVGSFHLADTSTRYIVVTAVDREGNESAESPEATVTAELIDTEHITDAAITTAKIDNLAVTDAKIVSLTADKITAGEIDASVIDVVNIDASEINTGTMSANRIYGGSIDASNVTITNLDADNINTGTMSANRISGGSIDASNVTITNLDADEISTGTLSASYISGGTLNASLITVTNLSASSINSGTLTAIAFRTASSGRRLEIDQSNVDRIKFYNSSGSLRASIGMLAVDTQLSIQTYSNLPLVIDLGNGVLSWHGDNLQGNPYGYGTYMDIEDPGSTVVFQLYGPSSGVAQIRMRSGSTTYPEYSFMTDTNSGLYLYAANQPGIVANGTVVYRSTSTETRIQPAYDLGGSGDDLVGVTSTGLLRNQSSTKRIKKFIKDAPELVDIKFRPVSYQLKAEFNKEREHQPQRLYGFVAEEVVEVFPEAAINRTDGSVNNFQDRAMLAVHEARIQRLEEEIRKLKEELYGGQRAA